MLLLLMRLVALMLRLLVVIRRDLLPSIGRMANEAAPARRQESGFGRERRRRLVRVPDAAAAHGHLGRQRRESCGGNV